MHTRLIPVVLIVLLGSACSRARVTTEIKADGSWNRTLLLTGQPKKEGMQMGPTLEDAFAVPSGAAWKTSKETKDESLSITLTRTLRSGAPLSDDVQIKDDDPAKMKFSNQVTVKPLGGNRFEYREVLKWTGAPAKDGFTDPKPQELADLKAALPKALATDENAKALARKTAEIAIPMIFGPGDPLLAIGLMHPDLAERKLSQRIGGVLLQALEQQFGNQMTPEQRRDVARSLLRRSLSNVNSSAKPSDPMAGPPAEGEKKKGGGGLTPLMFIVRCPGKVGSSNGEVDQLTGEAYWALFPEAVALRDITMTAVCEP